MKIIRMTLALTGALIAAVAYADQQQMNPNMPGMAGMAGMQPKAAEAHGVGAVRAIDTANTAASLVEAVAAVGDARPDSRPLPRSGERHWRRDTPCHCLWLAAARMNAGKRAR